MKLPEHMSKRPHCLLKLNTYTLTGNENAVKSQQYHMLQNLILLAHWINHSGVLNSTFADQGCTPENFDV